MNRDQKIRLAMAWMRRSHAAYANAVRNGYEITPEMVEGERAYHRWQKRAQRARARQQVPA